MKMQDQNILIIYKPSHRGIGILYAFCARGKIDTEIIDKIYKRIIDGDGYFSDIDDLNRFAFELCTFLNAPSVGLLSLERLNLELERAKNATELNEFLWEKADMIRNVDFSDSSRFLGNLFS